MVSKAYRYALIIFSFVILAAVVWMFNPLKTWNTIKNANFVYIFIAVIASSIGLFIRVLKWDVLLPRRFGIKKLFSVQLLGLTISNFTPGKVGEPIKSVLLKMTHRLDVSESLPSVIWERVLDLVVLIFFSLVIINTISLETNFSYIGYFGVAAFVVLIVLVVLVMKYRSFGVRMLKITKRLPVLKRISEGFIDTFYSVKIKKSGILKGLLLTSLAWIIDGVSFYFAFLSIGIELNPLILVGILSLSVIIGVASFLPGGIGSTEIVMVLLFGAVGVGGSVAVSGILLSRLVTFWWSVFIGVIVLINLSRKMNLKNLI